MTASSEAPVSLRAGPLRLSRAASRKPPAMVRTYSVRSTGKPLHAERAQAVIERQQEDRLQHDGREKAGPDGNAPRPARQHERRGKHGPVQQLQVLPDALVHR